jgi:DNA-binding MurR/RpiR family transcriptional regulator
MTPASTDTILNRILDHYQELPPQLRRAAQYVLDNPNEIGVNSMRQIAAAAEVKPNSLVRMARAIGFEGYEEFRLPFREALRKGANTFPDRARWLQSLAQGNSHGQLFSQMAAASLANVEQLFSNTSPDELKAVADLVLRSRATYVLGVGSCYALAQNFAYVARMAADNVVLVPRHGSLPIDDVSKIGESDVLIAMSFQPYRREVVEAARLAKRRGARLVALTDSRTSPLAFDADQVFVAPIGTPQFFPSIAAAIALLEALLAFLIAAGDTAVVANIEEFHRLRFETGVYWREA